MENHARTIMKTLSWRVLATSTTITLVYLFTRDIAISGSVGSLEALVKTAVYYLHERIWSTSNYGRRNSATKRISNPRNTS